MMNHPKTEERTVRLAVRMTPTEAGYLSALAEVDGLTVSDALRLSIRRQYAARFGEPSSVTMKPAMKKGRR
jgi:hypothetical protein